MIQSDVAQSEIERIDDLTQSILSLITTKTTKEVAQTLGINPKVVKQVCRSNGINLNGIKHKRYLEEIKLNLSLFESWSREMAWVLGVLMSDGSVTENGVLNLSLERGDEDCVAKVRDLIAPGKKLTYPSMKCQTGKITNYASFSIYSPEICKQLERYGIVPRKSLILKPPENVPDKYIPHFFRGLLDGDGTISFSGGTGILGFYGTYSLMKFVSETINRLLGLPEQTIYIREEDEIIQIAGVKWALKKAILVGNFIYADSTEETRMARKYNKYLQLIELQKEKDARHALKQWTPEEDAIVLKYYSLMMMPCTKIVKYLSNKSVDNVRKRVFELGLKRGRRGEENDANKSAA